MIKILEHKKSLLFIQIILFITINAFFILKYTARTAFDPLVVLTLYVCLITTVLYFIEKWNNIIREKTYKYFFLILLIILCVTIALVLINVDPYSIRVDRWSALTFFWDSFFQGKYPYGTHTHVSEINFPSPFPFWHLVSLPFYMLGDVGIGIIFFLIAVSLSVKYYFNSYKPAFLFLLFLLLSPGYWWEVFARSDSLSNAFFVFMIILWAFKMDKSLTKNFAGATLIVGLIAATRFTALLPIALFVFPAFLHLNWKKKVIFLLGAFFVAFIAFSPFVFWDTDTWIFFERNPFMSQTKNGSLSVFLTMIILGVLLALIWKNKFQYFFITSLFVFIFILSTQIVIFIQGNRGTFLEGSIVDLSYFNLILPYCLINFASFWGNKQENNTVL